MARSRRRRAPKRNRRPADWVYRPHIRDDEGALLDDLGSYEATFTTLATGQANQQARVLYDSFNYRSSTYPPGMGALNFAGFALGPSAKAEGRNALIRMVQGFLTYNPTTWAVGSTIFFAIRFGIYEQDATTGALLIDPTYTLINPSNDTLANPALFANDRRWQYERRFFEHFNENSSRFDASFRFRVNRLLKPNECYALIMEGNAAQSVSVQCSHWFRTLVSDEG